MTCLTLFAGAAMGDLLRAQSACGLFVDAAIDLKSVRQVEVTRGRDERWVRDLKTTRGHMRVERRKEEGQ